MKTISKRFLKGALAMLLAVVMLFGTTITGFAAVVDNADTSANVDVAETGLSCTFVFDNSSTKFSKPQILIGHSNWSEGYLMTQITGTNLWRYTASGWNDASQIGIMDNGTKWGGEGNSVSHRIGYAPAGKTSVVSISGSLSGVQLLVGSSLSRTSYTSYASLNTNQTAQPQYAAAGSSSYTNGTTGGTTSISTYKLTSATASDTSTGTTSASAARTATVTMTARPADGYNFVGWFTSTTATTATSTSTTLTYTCNGSAATYYARFQQAGYSYTVTAGDGGSVSPASGTATSVDITATPDDGYKFVSWQTTNGTVADASSATTTFTPSANSANAHATFAKKTYTVKFTDIDGNQIGNSQTVEHGATPTAPTAPAITGKTFAGWNPTVGAVTGDTTYQATYTDNTYSITVNQTGGTGTVNLGKTSAKYGDTVTLTVTPPANYKISSITGGGLNISECESYNGSFTMPASNVTITVNYVLAGTCAPHFAYGDQDLVLGDTFTNTASTNEYCEGDKTFTYESSYTSVATVNASTGLVTAKKPGTTTITATCDCGTTATYTVTVESPSVSVAAMTLAVNATGTATPTITDGPASGYTITYTASSEFFSVTADGIVTGIKPGSGTVNFTMTYGGNTVATGSFDVTVNTPVCTLEPLSTNLIVGQTMTADFETTSTPAAQSVTLSSADTSKVTISGKKATAVADAKDGVTITAAFKFNDSYTAYATAKVIVADPEITANPTSVALEFGEGATATSKTVALDTNAAAGNGTGDDVTVTSANSNVATATINDSTVTITATGVGSTTITAKFHDAEVEIPVTVTQYDPYVYLYVTNNNTTDDLYLYSWTGSSTNVTPVNTKMTYIGKNNDGDKLFAYRFLKTNKPQKFIITYTGAWGGFQTADISVSWSTTDHKAFYFSSTNSGTGMGDWTDDCMIVRPTVSVADVVVPVGGTETATATVQNGGVVYWTMADDTATVEDVDTQTSTVTGVTPGETIISARAFVDTANSSIKTLPTNYKTDTACWPFISTEATATVTVGSVDYNIAVNAEEGGSASITVDGVDKGASASVAHGDEYTLKATANENYRFVGWYKGDEEVSADNPYTATATSDFTYTAKFVKTHKVTVNFTEGIASVTINNVTHNESFDNITVDEGATVKVKATAAEGYKFSNWDLVYGDTTLNPTAEEYTIEPVNNSITLTAHAIPVYTATATAQTNKYFDTYGGTVTIDGQSSPVQYEIGDTVTFEAHNNENYYFDGWYSDADFTNKVSADENYQAVMTTDGITLYGLFVKDFYLTNSADERIATFVYNVADNSYSVTADFVDHFTLTSNDNNDVNAADVNVTGGSHVGCTVAGHYTSYLVTADAENYDVTAPVTYTLNPDVADGTPDGTYTMNITLQEAEKVEISVNGTKVADKAISSTFSYEIDAPDGQYLSGATTEPAVDFEIVDGKIEFVVPAQNVNIVPQFANYSYIEFNDTTGLQITGLKTGYKAGESVEITVVSANDSTTISDIVTDSGAATVVNNDGTWTITIGSMPADTTINVTATVDAKFAMDYGTAAIGNYGSGYTTYGTVSMKIGDTALAKGRYAAPTDTVTYTATPNTNFIFDGWYSDTACSLSNLLSRDTSYDVTPTEDTTIYALFVPKHYLAPDQAVVTSHEEMTYDPATRSFKYTSSTIAKDAWFRVSNNPTTSYWTDSDSYCIFDSTFSVTFNANAYLVTVGWGTQCYALTSDASAEYPYEIIVSLNGNSSIDVSCQASRSGVGSIYLSSGRLDLPGSYNATVFEATSIFKNEDIEKPADVYVANEGENREKYKRLDLEEAKTVSFETEITGTAASNYEIDSYVVYHIDKKSYEIVTPVSLGNNKYSGSVYVEGSCYIVPIYFLTSEYAEENNLAEIDIYFDATAIKDQAWGPFVACYAWGSNNAEYHGGWSGQMMIPSEDGKSFFTMLTVPKAGATGAPSIPNGVTFNNYTQSTVPGSNPGAFGISATQYQCYDYREPITLYEAGYDVITFVAKDSTDGYHGDRANGVTANTVTTSTTDIFNKYDFDYLYSRDGVTPMDFNGDLIENPVDLDEAKADYYVISKGDITYDPTGTKYVGDADFDADWAVDWYIFDNTGKYLTNILSTAMWHDKDNNLDELYTYLHEALGTNEAGVAGKTVAISYEHENNAGHQVSYDGQWYGNYLDDTVTAQVKVGFFNGTTYTVENDETPNVADYGEGYLDDLNGGLHQTLEVSLDYGSVDLHAVRNEGYTFIGWYTLQPDGSYHQISPAFDYHTYISLNETYYAMYREIEEGEVVINHSTYINPNDPAIPSHGGVSEMSIEIVKEDGTVLTSTPSTSRSSISFDGAEGETYTIRILTTPLMNGEFFAWYTDSYNADGSKTYEEVFTRKDTINSTSQVVAEFVYKYTADSLKTINIYSDVKRVTNMADLYYKYYNRYGDLRTYTVKDVPLTDDECLGFAGNNGDKYVPAYLTEYTFNVNNEEKIAYEGTDEYKKYVEAGYPVLKQYNKIAAYAPKEDVTEVFNGTVEWTVADEFLTTEKSIVTLIADQDIPQYTITWEANGKTGSKTDVYNTLLEIYAPATNANGKKFSYWYEEKTGEILTYTQHYNFRLVEDKDIKAVYGVAVTDKWTPSINSVTYTREFGDNGDYIYTDYLLSYNSSEGKELNLVKDEENIKYGLLLLRDADYYFEEGTTIDYPDAENSSIEAKLKAVALTGSSKAFTVDENTYNCYCYDLTSYSLTNFNRCNYFRNYNNNTVVGGSHYYREYAFTAVAYLIKDGTVYLSNPENVNFYALGIEKPTNTTN